MSKPAIRIATTHHPTSRSLDCSLNWLRSSAQLPQDKHRIKTGMHVPIRFFDVPSPITFLIPQDTSDHLFRLRRWLAHQAKIVCHVERGGDMIPKISVFT